MNWLFNKTSLEFLNILEMNPLTENVEIYNKIDTENVLNTKAIIKNVTSDSINLQGIRQILSPIGTLQGGQYVHIPSKNQEWLITTLPDNNKIYEKAIMEYCNWVLKWQDEDGNIFEYPCSIESTAKLGVEQGKYMTVGNAQYLLKISCDKNTIKLEIGKRFLIDKNMDSPTAYEVTKVNPISSNYNDLGIIELMLEQDQFDGNKDNKELMIADYIEPSEPEPEEPEIMCSITASGDKIKSGGKAITFMAIFEDSDDNILDDVIPIWDVIIPETKQQYLTITTENNELSIKCSSDAGNTPGILPFNVTVILKGEELDESITAELIIPVTTLFG